MRKARNFSGAAMVLLAALAYGARVSAQSPDFADSLTGGPDFWQVTGLAPGGRLNLRSGASVQSRVVATVPDGEVLRNRGCRLSGGERWCRVEPTDGRLQAWAAGRFLREAAPPSSAAPPRGGPGRPFDATGAVLCAVQRGQSMRDCAFGVVRLALGTANVRVTRPGGAARMIIFEGGVPVRSDASAPLTFERSADLFLIRVGDERYEIPEAVISGG
jgi:hypothetical protein